MINIRVDAQQLSKIHHGNTEALKAVLTEEVDKLKTTLVEVADPSGFRFQQGQVQAIEAVIKLLPTKRGG